MSRPISIIFAGTPPFAAESLKALLADPAFDVQLVITQPDKPVGRKQILTPPSVKVVASDHQIPIWQPENLNKEFPLSTMERPDFLVVVAYGQILSQAVLDFPLMAPVNVHASLLPKLRGASPIQHAVLFGEKESGVTIQNMAKELDAGPILSQEKMILDPRETSSTLYDKLSPMGARLLVQTLKAPLKPVEQDASAKTVCHKLSREDGVVDEKTMTAEEIDRKIRALVPWPGVTWNGIKLLESQLEPHPDALTVTCKDGSELFIIRLQVPGKTPVLGREFAAAQSK